ncbi:MAG: YraN family protein [Clostridia bacterium]
MYISHEIGEVGERLACKYLEENDYNILQKNFRCYQGEIDIIARDNIKNELVFMK